MYLEGGIDVLVAQPQDYTSSPRSLILGIGIVDDIVRVGLGENRWDTDYRESLKNHLRKYLLLLHLTDEGTDDSLGRLYDMYSNPLLVKQMHYKLKDELIPSHSATENPTKYKLMMQLDEWFEQKFHFRTDYEGYIEFYDVMAEHVRTLRTAIQRYRASFN